MGLEGSSFRMGMYTGETLSRALKKERDVCIGITKNQSSNFIREDLRGLSLMAKVCSVKETVS